MPSRKEMNPAEIEKLHKMLKEANLQTSFIQTGTQRNTLTTKGISPEVIEAEDLRHACLSIANFLFTQDGYLSKNKIEHDFYYTKYFTTVVMNPKQALELMEKIDRLEERNKELEIENLLLSSKK